MHAMPRRRIPTLVLAAVALMAAAIPLVERAQASDDLERQLRDQYKGKTFLLRGFYAGARLDYDSAGAASGDPMVGDWTVSGAVQVKDVHLSGHHLRIQARRLYLGWYKSGLQAVESAENDKDKRKAEEKLRVVDIDADFASGAVTADTASAALSRIFLNAQDHFADLVPDYWKPCVRAALSSAPPQQYSQCRVSPEFLAIPGMALGQDDQTNSGNSGAANQSAPPIKVIGVRNGVSPPKAITSPEPEFSDEARRLKYQGTIALMLIVDPEGNVRDVRVSSPLGCGLDKHAVERVSQWKFQPALKGGEPVTVEIAVEVDFHLY